MLKDKKSLITIGIAIALVILACAVAVSLLGGSSNTVEQGLELPPIQHVASSTAQHTEASGEEKPTLKMPVSDAKVGRDYLEAPVVDVVRVSPESGQALADIPKIRTERGTSLQIAKDYENGKHTRYRQYIDGIEVFGHQVIHHGGESEEDPGYYTGKFIDPQNKPHNNTPNISERDALTIARIDYGADDDSPISHVAIKLVHFIDKVKAMHLAFYVSFDTPHSKQGGPGRPRYIIDANSSQILQHWDALTHEAIGTGPGGNESTGEYEYGKDKPYLDVTRDESQTICSLANRNVETYNVHHVDDLDELMDELNANSLSPVTFTCPRHADDDATNGAYSPVNDAHYFGTVIVDMYRDWYKKSPLPYKLRFLVHFDTAYENAAWDPTYRVMFFGDGANRFYPLVALDVTSHEVGHGVTQENSNLAYFDEMGGLNEAFSDMAGKAAVFYSKGSNDWTLGSEISKNHRSIRFMDEPTKDGVSIADARDFEDDMNPHHSSGVFNKLFYKLATAPGWDTHKSFDVMFGANRHYWSMMSDFTDAAEGALYSAQELGYETAPILDAAREVGIGCQKFDKGFSCQLLPVERAKRDEP